MAMFKNNNSMSSTSNYRKNSPESTRHSNTQASAYVVDATTMGLTGFHFSTCGAGGPECAHHRNLDIGSKC